MPAAFALGIFSGKIILNFGVQKRLRAFLNPIFTGGVPLLFLFFCTKCSAGRVFLLTSGQMFRTIISSMESKTLYAGFCVTMYPFQAKRACLI